MRDQASGNRSILIRADGDSVIGSGHLRRCLALAVALRGAACECTFVCRKKDNNFNDLIELAGFRLVELDSSSDVLADADDTIALVSDHGVFDAVVVDHYGLDRGWGTKIRKISRRVVVIDDLHDRQHDCDVLIDAAPGDEKRYDGLVPDGCEKLLGPAYALLRPEFVLARGPSRQRSGQIDRVLISFGGTDVNNLTGEAIVAIRTVRPTVEIDAVLTSLSPHLPALRKLAEDDPFLSLHVDANNMSELMTIADLGLGAGGSTSWERACMGLPSLVVCIADNQTATIEALENHGAAIATACGPDFVVDLQRNVEWLSGKPKVMRSMSAAALGLVDGRGAQRVARAILSPAVMVTPATVEDSHKIWSWRNEPAVRATAVTSDEIPWENHQSWFSRKVAAPDTVMLIGYQPDREVGVVRFDLRADAATVSIFLAPDSKGRGLGRSLLAAGQQWIRSHHPAIRRLHADVRPGNKASIALFEGSGYSLSLLSFERAVND